MGAAGSGSGEGFALSSPCPAPDAASSREQMDVSDSYQSQSPRVAVERRWTSEGGYTGAQCLGGKASQVTLPKLQVEASLAGRRPRQLPSLTSAMTPPVSPTHTASTSTPRYLSSAGSSSSASSGGGSGGSISLRSTGGLASRRKSFQARSSSGAAEKLSVSTQPEAQQCGRGIRAANFQEEYDLGKELMPSCHKGMQVLNAKQRSNGHEVVVKVRFKKESFQIEGEERDWRSSTEYMLNLPKCTNIAQLFEVIEDEKAYYVIMEKVDGKDLFESIAGQELLPLEESKEIIAQILAGLAELHSRGRIHKDLKLENVMLDRTPSNSPKKMRAPSFCGGGVSPSASSVKLIDFDTVEAFVSETPKRTRDVLGTDQYIAQEAYDGKYSPASDVFAVGVIAYRLCAGKFPFKSDLFDDKPGENWVGSPKMKEIRNKLRTFKIKWSYKHFEQELGACDLVRSMLAVNDCDRPSAVQALSHKWLAGTTAAKEYFANGGNSPTRGGDRLSSRGLLTPSTSKSPQRSRPSSEAGSQSQGSVFPSFAWER
mmetsp:Transcript_99835/g.253893  ORF Transcript_99835/g.253893 Transcript_99835/m.253893 type:complete len:541 (+) Transcript_99835:105-1727(+)